MPESKRDLEARLARLDATTDEDIARQIAEDPDTAPELDAEWFADAEVWHGNKYLGRGKDFREGKRVGRPLGSGTKEMVTLRLDHEILNHFRAGGPGWQTRLNDTLLDGIKQHQIEAVRRAAYETGYVAAMQVVREFAIRPTAAATAAPQRQSREQAQPAPRQIRRGDNAWHIAEAMMSLPDHTGPAAAIKKALAEKGHDIPYASIRYGLGKLADRHEVAASDDGKTWRYIGRAHT